MGVNEAPVEPQSHALPEPAGENKSFPRNHQKVPILGTFFISAFFRLLPQNWSIPNFFPTNSSF